MTDTQRWRRIAEEFEEPKSHSNYGLCWAWKENGGGDGRAIRATFAAIMAAMTKRERAKIWMP